MAFIEDVVVESTELVLASISNIPKGLISSGNVTCFILGTINVPNVNSVTSGQRVMS